MNSNHGLSLWIHDLPLSLFSPLGKKVIPVLHEVDINLGSEHIMLSTGSAPGKPSVNRPGAAILLLAWLCKFSECLSSDDISRSSGFFHNFLPYQDLPLKNI